MSHQKLLNSLLKQKKQATLQKNNNINNTKPQNRFLEKKSTKKEQKPTTNPPSLKEMMSLLNMFDPNSNFGKDNDFDDDIDEIVEKTKKDFFMAKEKMKQSQENNEEIETAKKLDKMYVKKTDENPNKYLFCSKTNMYLPVGYRYAGYHTSRKTGKKTYLYTRKEEDSFVVHCLGQQMDTHNNYDVYQQIDLTQQLPTNIMENVANGIEIQL